MRRRGSSAEGGDLGPEQDHRWGWVHVPDQAGRSGGQQPGAGKSAAEYYTETGNPPGRWKGLGLEALGLAGQVSEEQMTALFGLGPHPNAEAITAEFRREHVRAGMDEGQLRKVNDHARKAAALGRPFANFEDLGPFDERVAAYHCGAFEGSDAYCATSATGRSITVSV